MTGSNEDKALASCNAADGLKNEATTLLEPGRLADGDFTNGVSGHAAAAPIVSNSDASNKVAHERAPNTPGSDLELQELIKDSPFLDLNSPMTPYEWFKFVIMVMSLWLYMHDHEDLQATLIVACTDV